MKKALVTTFHLIMSIIIIFLSFITIDLILRMDYTSIAGMRNSLLKQVEIIKNPLLMYETTANIQRLIKIQGITAIVLLYLYHRKRLYKYTRGIRKRLIIQDEVKRNIIIGALYSVIVVVIIYAALLAAEIWLKIYGKTLEEMFAIIKTELDLLKNPILIYQKHSNKTKLFLTHLTISAAALSLLYYSTDRKSEFNLKEKGSAKWATDKDRLKYGLDVMEGNIILSQTEFLPLDMREIYRNVNIMIIGGSGTGKTRYFVKPNLMQMNSSYIITDPKGELYRDTAYMLEQNGYDIKVLNLKDPSYTDGYNPFHYVEDENDIDVLSETIMKNTLGKDKKANTGDPFWENSSKALLSALLHYTNRLEEKDRNLITVFKLLLEGKMEDEGEITELDIRFEELDEDHPGKNYYEIFRLAPMRTRNSILISLGTQLAFLGSQKVRNVVVKDTMELRNHDKKRAIFVIIPDANGAYDVLAAIFYTQMFQILYSVADKQPDGQLAIHHQFILDEFANIGKIPNFVELISTMRSRKISAIPIVQNQAQLENLYDKNTRTIIGNCDTVLYLGGSDQQAAKEISERLGKATITVTDVSRQKNEGQSSGYTRNTRKDYRELMTPDEVLRLPDEELIITIRGFKPFKSKKYDITSHKKYSLLEAKKTFIEEKYEKDANIKDMVEEYESEEVMLIDIEELTRKTEELLQRSSQILSNAV